MRRIRLGRLIAGCALLLLAAPCVVAVDVQELIGKAAEADLELQKLVVSRRIAELKIAQSAAGRGWKLAVGATDTGLRFASNLAAGAPALTLEIDPYVAVSAPDPARTSVSLVAPLSVTVPGGTFSPALSAGVTQPLTSLITAPKDRRVRELGETISLVQSDAAAAARMHAVAQGVIGAVKALVELRLSAGDLVEQLLDIADEAARTKALDPDAERGSAYKLIDQRKAGVEASLQRARREYEIRRARLEKDLKLSLGDSTPAVPDASLVLPSQTEVEVNPAVRSAGLEVSLAEARLEQQSLSRLPGLSIGASVGLAKGSSGVALSLPVAVEFEVTWQALDSGLRKLTRQELEAQLELRKLSLEQARRAFVSALADLELEAAGLEDRNADARRNQEAAVQSVSETRLLVEKGLKTDRELAKAEYTVRKRAIQLELVALDRFAFTYKVKALVLTP
jgi:hypothetical protein